jgi:hypothetical protein
LTPELAFIEVVLFWDPIIDSETFKGEIYDIKEVFQPSD